MIARVEIVAILGSLGLLAIVLELVRRRQLAEGYSLVWLLTTIVLVVLSFWREFLERLAELVGIFYAPAALFVFGFGFVLIILLQFSVIISRLSRKNKQLAQRLAILEWKFNRLHNETSAEEEEAAE